MIFRRPIVRETRAVDEIGQSDSRKSERFMLWRVQSARRAFFACELFDALIMSDRSRLTCEF